MGKMSLMLYLHGELIEKCDHAKNLENFFFRGHYRFLDDTVLWIGISSLVKAVADVGSVQEEEERGNDQYAFLLPQVASTGQDSTVAY